MTHNPPQHPAGIPGDPMIDVVPGQPPIGHTVWRTPTAGEKQPVTERLAYRLLAAFTTAGDTVVDLTDSPTLATVAEAGGRSHVKARFNGDRTIVVIATSIADHQPTNPWHPLCGADPPEITEWFGDDLRDPDRPAGTTTEPASVMPAGLGGPSLVVALWPLHPRESANTDRLADLMAAAAAILRPGGCLCFIAAHGSGGEYTTLTAAARAAGLVYFQHIVAVRAEAGAEQFTYHYTDQELAAARAGGHLNVHTDLILYVVAADSKSRDAVPGGAR